MSKLFLVVCFGAYLAASEEPCETCTRIEDVDSTLGDALLQTKHSKVEPARHTSLSDVGKVITDVRPNKADHVSALSDAVRNMAGYSAEGYQGSPSCVPAQQETENFHKAVADVLEHLRQSAESSATAEALEPFRQSASFVAMDMKRDIGSTASLDAKGFLETTSLCCPPEMETFFNRLLDSLGYDVCGKAHVQGLMHWFACVPNMDFQYVLDVIANGNPCKYWTPTGQDCPALSPECDGHHCGNPMNGLNGGGNKAGGVTLKPPATTAAPAPATTAPTTTAPTTSPPTTTQAPTTTTLPIECEGVVEFNFWDSYKSHNNLNGEGPDKEPQNLRLSNMGSHNGKAFDLVISSTTDRYKPPPDFAKWNGVYDHFGYIAMILQSSMDAKFQVVEANTSTPMVLPKFLFSFFDMDAGVQDGVGAAESTTISGFAKYYVADSTELTITTTAEGKTKFEASVYGDSGDNPIDPMNMTQLAMNRAVTFLFLDTSEFEITYELRPGGSSDGREVYFAGRSQLVNTICP